MRPQRLGDLVLRWRYLVLTAVAGGVYAHGLVALHGYAGGDWFLFTLGASYLESSHALHLFAQLPLLQTGPLSVLLSVPLSRLGPNAGWDVTSALLFCAAVGIIRLCELAAGPSLGISRRQLESATLVSGCLLIVACAWPATFSGHPDDLFALAAIAGTVWSCSRGRWTYAAAAVGLAAAFKPWGIYFLPLAATVEGRRWHGILLALVVAVVPWMPFILGDHGTLDVAHFHFISVGAASSLRIVGVAIGSHPSWIRLAQLIVTVALGAVAVSRRQWQFVPLIVTVARINLEVRWFPYYGVGVLFGAMVADMMQPNRLPGSRTALAWLLLYGAGDVASLLGGPPSVVAVVLIASRLVLLLVVLVELLRPGVEAGDGRTSRLAVRAGCG